MDSIHEIYRKYVSLHMTPFFTHVSVHFVCTQFHVHVQMSGADFCVMKRNNDTMKEIIILFFGRLSSIILDMCFFQFPESVKNKLHIKNTMHT